MILILPPFQKKSLRFRDENGAETDGTKWCHICFHIFFVKAKTNTETPQTNTKIDIVQKPLKQIQK
jgi:hypothetical protein